MEETVGQPADAVIAADQERPIQSGSDAAAAGTEECDKQLEEQIEGHPFCEPWEDSDLVLTVEDDTFYVHRQILSLHSPVFKAMLNSQFKEATATVIPLPGKKENEVLDFLKALYLKGTAEITLKKVRHLLKLADEYQTQGVLDLCVKCLRDVPKYEDNVVTILFLATDTVMARNDCRLDGVRRECETLVEDMELADITGKSDFKNLNRDSMESVLVRRSKRLETCLKGVYPQLVGLVEYCLFMKLDRYASGEVSRCPQHFPGGGRNVNKANRDLVQRIRKCSVCRGMIQQLVSSSVKKQSTATASGYGFPVLSQSLGAGSRVTAPKEYLYGGSYHFDEELITLLKDIDKLY